MQQPFKSFVNWSGGKDSALTLYYALQNKKYSVEKLLTNIGEDTRRVTMHGVEETLLVNQANALGLPLVVTQLPHQPSMEVYESRVIYATTRLKQEGFTHSLFGDIFLEDLYTYRTTQMKNCGMQADFPLWKKDTKALLLQFINLGFKAVVVCTNAAVLDKSFTGRIIDQAFLNDLPDYVDPCGENGEYHTFVFDGPIFKHPVKYTLGQTVLQNYPVPQQQKDNCFNSNLPIPEMGFWFADLLPE